MEQNHLKTGDLIGVAGIESDWGAAIMASSKRKIYTIYDHVGMLELQDEAVFVWNANPHDGVIRESLDDFVSREESQIRKTFDIYRLTEEVDFAAVIKKMSLLTGLPYNFSFIASNQAYYCSDFVARTFPDGVFPLEPMHFVGDYWQEYYGKQGIAIPEGQRGINPNDMFAQSNMTFVGNLRELLR